MRCDRKEGHQPNVIKLVESKKRLHTKKVWGLFTLAKSNPHTRFTACQKATQMAEKPVCRCPDL